MIELDVAIRTRRVLSGEERSFRILLMGNFGGVVQDARLEPSVRARVVDLDNLDEVINAVRPRLQVRVPGSEEAVDVEFKQLDDFHPDELYRRLPLFQNLVRSTNEAPPATAGPGLLDSIVERQSPAPEPRIDLHHLGSKEWDSAIERMIAPHTIPPEDPRHTEPRKSADAAIAQAMRAVLHDPGFQEVEAAWRSVDFILRRLATGREVTLQVADVQRDSIVDGLTRLVAAAEQSWDAIVALYTFDANPEHIDVLAAAGRIAQQAGSAFLAGVNPEVAEAANGAERDAWAGLRGLPESQWVGVVAPRFLLRVPYGKDTISVESFNFEEMPSRPVHDEYVWGNGAVICAYVMAARSRGETSTEITGVPAHTYRQDGQAAMTPCAEFWLTERVVENYLDAGIMPLVSIKNRDSIWLLRLQSVNEARPNLP